MTIPRAGKIVGTADYLAPEQIRNPRNVGPASDIYALGCTLYYCVTGKVPFPGGDTKSKCKRHCEQTPWHPRKFAPELSEEFVDTIADMMEKDPARRISSATEVAERLEQWSQTAYEAIDRPIDRQAWTPPPPPSEPQQIAPPPPPVQGSESASELQTSGGLSVSASDASVPAMASGLDNDFQVAVRPSHTVAIAIALSVAVPISILIGAIIGFFVRELM